MHLLIFFKKIHIRLILLIVAILAVPFWLYHFMPEYLEIPTDLNIRSRVDSFDNFYNPNTQSYAGENRSVTNFSYEAVAGDSDLIIIKNNFEVKSINGEKIFTVSRLYGVDAHSGKHMNGKGDRDRAGYLFAPRMKGINRQVGDKSPFDYWHVNYDTPIRMDYRAKEELFGLSVYRYESNFSVDQTKELTGVLDDVGVNKGVVLNVHLDLWVEPYTGKIVKYSDNAEAFYYSLKDGNRLYPWNKFRNSTSVVSVKEQATLVTVQKQTFLTLSYSVTAILLLIILLLILYPLLLRIFSKRDDGEHDFKKILLPPILSAFLIFVLSVVLAISASVITKQQREADFNAEIERINTLIENRFANIVNVIAGARGLFDASSSVERDEWSAYVSSLELEKNYPGIQGVGFGKYVKESEKIKFIDVIKKEGFKDFNINPAGVRDAYVPVTFIEPFNDRNKRAFGFDMFSNPTRMEAMIYARNSGGIGVTGKVVLAQESDTDIQPGFLIYEPVYKPVQNDMTIKERQTNIYGYTYAALRMNNFMTGIFVTQNTPLGVEIFDGSFLDNSLSKESLMYKNDIANSDSSLTKISELNLYNKKWTIRYTAPYSFGANFLRNIIPLIVVLVGTVISILVFFVIYSLNTRRAKAEIMAREITKELAYETNKLELATKSAKIGVWEWDVVKNVLVWDDQMYDLYGIKKEDFGGAYDAWQKGLHPDDKKAGDEAIKLALSGKKDFNTNFRVVWPNGEVRYMRAYATVQRDNKGNPLRMVGVNFDITFEKEIDRAKTEFVSLASHQLKTPIGSIQWDLEMLKAGDYGAVSDKQKEILDEAYKMSQRMNELVNALLNVSRIEMGVFIIEPKPTDFKALCEEVLQEMKPRLSVKNHEVIRDIDLNIPLVPADDKLLRVIFQNFISNAIKYTPDNGRIKISLKVNDSNITFSVANNGAPIPEKDQPNIFTKMFRASNAQEQDPDGNGLGLYVVKEIVEKAGGKIWFTSKAGQDTLFACSFPLSGMLAKSGTKSIT